MLNIIRVSFVVASHGLNVAALDNKCVITTSMVLAPLGQLVKMRGQYRVDLAV